MRREVHGRRTTLCPTKSLIKPIGPPTASHSRNHETTLQLQSQLHNHHRSCFCAMTCHNRWSSFPGLFRGCFGHIVPQPGRQRQRRRQRQRQRLQQHMQRQHQSSPFLVLQRAFGDALPRRPALTITCAGCLENRKKIPEPSPTGHTHHIQPWRSQLTFLAPQFPDVCPRCGQGPKVRKLTETHTKPSQARSKTNVSAELAAHMACAWSGRSI